MRHLVNRIAALTAILVLPVVAAPVLADETQTPAFRASGSATVVSDYRFRGVSLSNNGLAVEAGIGVAHKTGLYAGFWASSLAGWGTFGGSNIELDLFGGYKLPVGAGTLDVGLTWYMYPGGADNTDFAEPFAKLSGSVGPLGLLAGVAYAPPQEALGNWLNHPDSRLGDKEHNLYVWGDSAYGVKNTPVTIKAHVGYSNGNPGLGPNGTSDAPTGSYFDWLLGADYVLGPVTLGVAYVDTDIDFNSIEAQRLQPNFSQDQRPGGKSISDARVVFSVSATF